MARAKVSRTVASTTWRSATSGIRIRTSSHQKTVQAEVADAFEAALKRTLVLLRYPAGDDVDAHASNSRRQLGYYNDSLSWATLGTGRKDEDWFYLAALRKDGPAEMGRWKTVPLRPSWLTLGNVPVPRF